MEWKEVRLGELCTCQEGYVNPSQKHPEYFDGNIKWIRAVDLNNARVYNTSRTLTKEGYESAGKSALMFEPNTIVISKSGTIGRLAILTDYMCGNRATINIKPKDVKDLEFIFYLLLNSQSRFLDYAVGSVQKNLYVPILKEITFSIPQHKIYQRCIASILSSLDRKIELNNKINAQLEEMAQAIFKSWFVDFEPFKDGKFVESELGLIPEGWRVGTLSEIAEINPKRPLKKGEEATYLDMKNMPTSGSFPNQWEKKIMNGGMKFQNGDTLMARITPCLENGKVAYVNFLDNKEVGFGSTEYIVMTSKSCVFPEIFYTLCRYPDFVAYATRNMNGSSGRQRVSGEVIGNYKLVIPPTNVIEKLQPLYASIMEQIKEHGFENLHLAQLRDTLLPKLMNGEIEI